MTPSDRVPPPSNWTPEREARARHLFLNEGLTAGEVADALGAGITRAAVVGKMRRLGCSKREARRAAPPTARVTPGASRQRCRQRLPPMPPPIPLPPLRDAPATGRACRLACLPANGCRWPVDDPGPGQMHAALFCAGPATQGAYCDVHHALARR